MILAINARSCVATATRTRARRASGLSNRCARCRKFSSTSFFFGYAISEGSLYAPFTRRTAAPIWNQRVEIFFRAVKIGLQANADVGIGLARAAIELERHVHVRTSLHVNPEDFVGGSILDQLCEIFVAEVGIEVEPELA